MKMTATCGIQKFRWTCGIQKFRWREKNKNTCQNIGGHQHRTTHADQILGGRDHCNSCSTDAYDNINWLSFQSYSGIPNAQPLLFFDKN